MPSDLGVSDLLLEWEDRAAEGRPVSPEELCRARPELLVELRHGIDLLRFVSPLLELDGETAAGAPPAIPGFEVLDRLGGGGMGVVYRARDMALARVVAIKVPHLRILSGEAARSRFEREARVLAQLRHPNIVPVHAAGLANGQAYFVMDYIPRGSLAGQVSRLTGQVRAVVAIIELVARAVQHAHEHGILHRDLKPANVLLDERDQPLVADFGLAKIAGAESRGETTTPPGRAGAPPAEPESQATVPQLTLPGVRPGTPAYMAPEQLDPARGAVGPATDVWALGVILFELLTGRRPFARPDGLRVVAAACEEPPPSPRSHCRNVDPWLESIVLKCLEKAPKQRYATATALADDLARWRRGDPPSTVREGRVRGLLRRVRRRLALVIAPVLLLACVIFALTYHPQPPTLAEVDRREEEAYRKTTAPLVRELAQGRPVSLLPSPSRPSSVRWRAGQGKVVFHDNPEADRAVSFSAPAPSLLELLPDTGMDAYRLVVELRHDTPVRGGVTCELAVAFAGSRVITEDGPQFFSARVKFADRGPQATVFRDQAGRPAGCFQLGFSYLRTTRSEIDRTAQYGGPALFYSPAPDSSPGPWRRIEVEIRPDEWRVQHWGGEVIRLAPGTKWPQAFAHFQRQFPDLGHVEAPLAARGCVGLYLDASVTSLRRFDVEPLGDGE
jgi:hypothetical protein